MTLPRTTALCSAALLSLACAARQAAPVEAEPEASPRPAAASIPSLSKAYQGKFLVGTAVTPGQVMMGDTHLFLEHQFSVVTPEDAMKPINLGRREGTYDFAMADEIVDWAARNGIKVRGHCLVWHQQEQPWIFTQDGKPVSREVLVERLRRYIHDVVGHYRGKVWAWDVVQEAVVAGEPGIDVVDGGWRNSPWYRILGPEFVELAFRFAHEADPDALLFYNDYDTENPAKRRLIVELVRSLQAKGVPIHGVGHQAHLYQQYPPVAELEASLQAIAALGLRNHVTELDISLRPRALAPTPEKTPELLAEHARRYGEVFRMLRRNAVEAVVLWGVNDEGSWGGQHAGEMPLLFSDFTPKAEFRAVMDEAGR